MQCAVKERKIHHSTLNITAQYTVHCTSRHTVHHVIIMIGIAVLCVSCVKLPHTHTHTLTHTHSCVKLPHTKYKLKTRDLYGASEDNAMEKIRKRVQVQILPLYLSGKDTRCIALQRSSSLICQLTTLEALQCKSSPLICQLRTLEALQCKNPPPLSVS